ncbi:MAG: DNA-processing protein DprA [Planctomycetota bacterium]|nr:DNA-processing protein DprA [Planctomycetota bacterium]
MNEETMEAVERDALLMLTLTPGLGPRSTRRALEAHGSAQAVMQASAGDFSRLKGVGDRRGGEIRKALDDLADGKALAREKELMAQYGARAIALGEPDYPKLLALIDDAPPVLFVRGELRASDATGLAIVGSRKCTAYGREQADRFAALAAGAGLTVVSGGAYGIDAAAHRASVRVQGRTIAVLGSGLAKPYPAEHAELFDLIAAEGAGRGAVVSELPMGSPPARENFPARNRLISGLSLGVLVIEASEQSGALITARLAAEDHGREVMALPGRVDSAASAGCHRLLRSGAAALVTNIAEVLESLGETGTLLKAGLEAEIRGGAEQPAPSLFAQNLTGTQQKLFEALEEPGSIDELSGRTRLGVAVLQADLTLLQIRGLVTREDGKFVRKG